jgi:hypothetical protein
MKTSPPIFLSALSLGALLFFLAGCTASQARAPRPALAPDFKVVETSTEKELTPAQLAGLRAAVSDYLHEREFDATRPLYVKLSLPADNPGDEPGWALIRIGEAAPRDYTVLSVYPGDRYDTPYDYYRNGYYNPAYAGFSRWGYYDPFDYNYGRTRPHGHTRPPPNQPVAKPESPVPVPAPTPQRPRWETPNRPSPDQPRAYPPRSAHPERWARERAQERAPERAAERTPREQRAPERESGDGGRASSPLPAPNYTPPPIMRSEPPAAREENSRLNPHQPER